MNVAEVGRLTAPVGVCVAVGVDVPVDCGGRVGVAVDVSPESGVIVGVAVSVGDSVLVGVKVEVAVGDGVAVSVSVGVGVGVVAVWVSTMSCGAFPPDSRLAKLTAVLPGTTIARL